MQINQPIYSNSPTNYNPISQNNFNNYDQFIRNKKFEQQKSYKEVLDNQVRIFIQENFSFFNTYQVTQRDSYGMNKSHPHLTRRNHEFNPVTVNPCINIYIYIEYFQLQKNYMILEETVY